MRVADIRYMSVILSVVPLLLNSDSLVREGSHLPVVNCKVSQWSSWSRCKPQNRICGDGIQTKTRTIQVSHPTSPETQLPEQSLADARLQRRKALPPPAPDEALHEALQVREEGGHGGPAAGGLGPREQQRNRHRLCRHGMGGMEPVLADLRPRRGAVQDEDDRPGADEEREDLSECGRLPEVRRPAELFLSGRAVLFMFR